MVCYSPHSEAYDELKTLDHPDVEAVVRENNTGIAQSQLAGDMANHAKNYRRIKGKKKASKGARCFGAIVARKAPYQIHRFQQPRLDRKVRLKTAHWKRSSYHAPRDTMFASRRAGSPSM